MAGVLKKTTGLVGLAVCETPREVGVGLLSLETRFPIEEMESGLTEIGYTPVPSTLYRDKRLKLLYSKILDALEFMPSNAAYRKYTKQITNERLTMVKEETDLQKLEDKLQAGQLEEVILQAENELSPARKMLTWKPWEPLVEEPPANQWKWPL